jgi:hypothetical protein
VPWVTFSRDTIAKWPGERPLNVKGKTLCTAKENRLEGFFFYLGRSISCWKCEGSNIIGMSCHGQDRNERRISRSSIDPAKLDRNRNVNALPGSSDVNFLLDAANETNLTASWNARISLHEKLNR